MKRRMIKKKKVGGEAEATELIDWWLKSASWRKTSRLN
jgi:hypothetical protein